MTKMVGQPDRTQPGRNVRNNSDFLNMFKERADFLSYDVAAYVTYRKAYTVQLKKEKEGRYSDKECTETRIDLLDLEFYNLLKDNINEELREEGISFRSYLLPLSFFLFTYFAGFLITLPLINSVFIGKTETTFIPLFSINSGIPILVIQWGFLGGFVYTSISLLSRFLRNDLVPRVYVLASLRLLLSAVVAIVIFFLYMLRYVNTTITSNNDVLLPQILLMCFLAGVAPVQLLINFADNQMSRIYNGWKRRSIVGDRPLTQLEGLNSITAERLNEEGIDSIQQMALSDIEGIVAKTKFPLEIIGDWKDQAILYLLTGDIVIKDDVSEMQYLNDVLDKKLGIRTISALLDIYKSIADSQQEEGFFKGFGLLGDNKISYDRFHYVFKNVVTQGRIMWYHKDPTISSSH